MRFGKNNHVLSPLAILLIGGSLFTALLLTTTIPAQANPATPDTRHVTILHTNDIHGHLQAWQGWEGDFADRTVGGLDRLAARVTEIRAEVGKQRVLLLDAGDTIGDTMIAAKTEGRAVIETMNSIGYDAMAVGNHEPDFSAEKLKARIAQARFAVLGANIVEQSTGDLFTEPYILCEVDGLKVGILGIAYPNTPLTTAHKNVDNLRFRSPVETAREYVPRMRDEGAEIIVALTHLGLAADKELAKQVSGIDVIVGGHSHNRMKDALKVGGTLIVQAGAHGSDLGRLDLTIEQGRILSHRRTLMPIIEGESEATVARIINQQIAPHASAMNERIGRAASLIVRPQTISGQQAEPRDQESPADSLFADAIRETTQTDIAFLPGVGYGVAIQPGDITAAELRNLIPHNSAVWTMRLRGAQIRQVLEQSIENFTTTEDFQKVGGIIQVSGLRFSFDPTAPEDRRVRDVSVGGHPLSVDRHYTVSVNTLLAQGGHNYETFTQGKERREIGKQYEMVRDWIARQGEIQAPPTGRITKLAEKGK